MRKRSGKHEAAVLLGRSGGLRGGRARARALSDEERSASARHAATARWRAADPPVEAASSTRERLFRAAAVEFLRHGFQGARVDRIVRAAGVNKRMLYHYFGSKDALYRQLLSSNLTRLQHHAAETPPDLGASFAYWQELMLRNPAWIRASLLEALAAPKPPIASGERRAFWQSAVDQIREAQDVGVLDAALPAAHLQLALVAIVMFPLLLPQFTQFIAGSSPLDPAFIAGQLRFLDELAALLQLRTGPTAGSAVPRASARRAT